MSTAMSATQSRWRHGRLLASTPEGAGARLLRVRPEKPLDWRAGQVVELAAPDSDAGYFAICSAPAEGPEPRFLVKAGGAASDALLAVPVGGVLRLSAPLGPGYPLERAAGRDLLLVGAGTGIAPLRAALAQALADRDRFGEITVLHGARTLKAMSFAADHAAWRAAGVRVCPVLSRPTPATSWTGRTGWVQAHLGDVVTPGALVLVAGMEAMERDVRRVIAGLGVAGVEVRNNLED